MARYIVGRMSHGVCAARLVVDSEPPRILEGGKDVRVHAHGTSTGYLVKRGVVQEWRERFGAAKGARIVLRVFPEEFAEDLAAADARLAEAQRALEQVRAERQELLETLVARSRVPKLEEIRVDREAWKAREPAKSNLSDASHMVAQLNGLMAQALSKGG
jgi:hypothetical protein